MDNNNLVLGRGKLYFDRFATGTLTKNGNAISAQPRRSRFPAKRKNWTTTPQKKVSRSKMNR